MARSPKQAPAAYTVPIARVKSRGTPRVAQVARLKSPARVAPRSKPTDTKRKSAARGAPETAALLSRLAARCKVLRAEAGLTQQSAAERAGIAVAHLQVVERGATNPTVAIIGALARAYEITLAELFRGI